jgi:hypothetical protein
MAGTCPVGHWRQRSTRTNKAVLRAAADRPVLGTFLDDRLEVLVGKVGYMEAARNREMLLAGLGGGP